MCTLVSLNLLQVEKPTYHIAPYLPSVKASTAPLLFIWHVSSSSFGMSFLFICSEYSLLDLSCRNPTMVGAAAPPVLFACKGASSAHRLYLPSVKPNNAVSNSIRPVCHPLQTSTFSCAFACIAALGNGSHA